MVRARGKYGCRPAHQAELKEDARKEERDERERGGKRDEVVGDVRVLPPPGHESGSIWMHSRKLLGRVAAAYRRHLMLEEEVDEGEEGGESELDNGARSYDDGDADEEEAAAHLEELPVEDVL